jgi:hypothetical protein
MRIVTTKIANSNGKSRKLLQISKKEWKSIGKIAQWDDSQTVKEECLTMIQNIVEMGLSTFINDSDLKRLLAPNNVMDPETVAVPNDIKAVITALADVAKGKPTSLFDVEKKIELTENEISQDKASEQAAENADAEKERVRLENTV